MIKIIVSDLSRVLLFPADSSYKESLNALCRSLNESNPAFDFWKYFKLNETLISVYESLQLPLHVFTSDSIQDHPALKERLNVFTRVMSAKKLNVSKEDTKAYIAIAKKLHVAPHEILYIDDNVKNIEAASSAGLQTIYFESNEETMQKINKLLT